MNKIFPIPYISLAGILMSLFSLMIIYFNYEQNDILENGKIVEVVIVKTPDHCTRISSKDILVVFFNYKNKRHSKNVSEKWCKKINVGDKIEMKTNHRESDFMFTWEKDKDSNIGAGYFLVIIGLVIIYKGYKDR